jgi:TolB-like protein
MNPRRFFLFGLALGLILAAAAVAGPVQAAERRVAVLYFENTGNPELEMLKLGLAEMLISDLTGQPGLEVIERGRINDLLGELDLQKSDKVDQSTAVEMGRLLGVQRIVIGSYFELMGQFQLMGRVIEVETGVIVGADQHNGAVADFMTLEDRLAAGLLPFLSDESGDGGGKGTKATGGGRVRGEGGGDATASTEPEPTPAESADAGDGTAVESVEPAANADPLGAALAFSEGLDYLDRKDIRKAREALERAVDLDPSLDAARDELSKINI